MIIQCEQCHTKFKLDDSKVTDKGVKVRCAKCKHVFTVTKEQPPEEPVTPFENLLNNTVLAAAEPPPLAAAIPDQIPPKLDSFVDSSDHTLLPKESYISTPAAAFDPSSFDFSSPDDTVVLAPPTIASSDNSDFSLLSLEENDAFSKDVPSEEVDFGAFDFGDTSLGDETVVAPATVDFGEKTIIQPKETPTADDFGGLDFSGDSLFGEVVPQIVEEPANDISFDLQMDDFAASMGVEGAVEKHSEADAESEQVDAPFSLGEIDFGDELSSVAVQQVNPDELKPGQDFLFAPLVETQNQVSAEIPKMALNNNLIKPEPAISDELPPLSISTRRKQSSMTAILVALGVVLAIVAAYFGYSYTNNDKPAAPQEAGHISIRSVEASYIKNKVIGELLVIKGEAVNEFTKPRAAIQVKAAVYGGKGNLLVSKNVFCGNQLTVEQLSTLSLDAIETAMANQFGDSLANMEVPPGKGVPFFVVFVKPAADAKDYAVEPAGSTLATAKQ